MVLTTNHVLDFLNQMNFLTPPTIIADSESKRGISWALVSDASRPTSLEKEGVYIVSFRFDVDSDGPEGAQRYMLSTVFSDGVFGQGNVGVPVETSKYLHGSLNDDGNLTFDGGQVLNAGKIYDVCYTYLQDDRESGPGILGPNARYMKETGN